MFLLSTDCLKGYGLNRIFRFAKEAGIDGIELGMDVRRFDTQNADYLNELQKEYDLPIRVVKTFPNSTIRQSEMVLEIAKDVGAEVVVLDPPRFFDFKYKEWMKKQVPLLRKKYGFKIALMNGSSEYVWGIIPGRAMTSMVDLQNFKEVCLNISHLYEKKMDLMRAYELIKSHLVHVHLSNVFRGKEKSLLNDGIMPLESFLTKLKKDTYAFDISLLVSPTALAAGDDKIVTRSLKQSKAFVDRYLK